jgi:hypothetical protein
VLLTLDDAGAGDEEELAAPDRDIADFKVVCAHRGRITASQRVGKSGTFGGMTVFVMLEENIHSASGEPQVLRDAQDEIV